MGIRPFFSFLNPFSGEKKIYGYNTFFSFFLSLFLRIERLFIPILVLNSFFLISLFLLFLLEWKVLGKESTGIWMKQKGIAFEGFTYGLDLAGAHISPEQPAAGGSWGRKQKRRKRHWRGRGGEGREAEADKRKEIDAYIIYTHIYIYRHTCKYTYAYKYVYLYV